MFELFALICPNKEINTSQTQIKTKVEISAYPCKNANPSKVLLLPNENKLKKTTFVNIR